MKHMIRNTGIFIALFIAAVILIPHAVTYAHNEGQLMVAVTPYSHGQNLDFFFINSDHPLLFVEEEGETPVFVSIITPEQKAVYEKSGYKPVIIDENAGELTQYYIHSAKYEKLTNLDDELTRQIPNNVGIEMAYQLSTYKTFFKLTPGVDWGEVKFSGKGAKFHEARRIHWDLYPPIDRTTIAAFKEPVAKEEKKGIPNPFPMFFSIVIPLFIIYLIFRRRKKRA